jgi:hypothetical protein
MWSALVSRTASLALHPMALLSLAAKVPYIWRCDHLSRLLFPLLLLRLLPRRCQALPSSL